LRAIPRSQALGRPGPAALPDADRGRGAGRLLRRPHSRGPLEPKRTELLGGRRPAAQGRGHECRPDCRAAGPVIGLSARPARRATGLVGHDLPRSLLPPSFRPQRAVPPGGALHEPGRGLGSGPARRPVHRCGTRLRSRLLRAKELRTPGLAQTPDRACGAARSLVGDRGGRRPRLAGRHRVAHLRPGARPAAPLAAAIAPRRSTFRLVLSYDGTDYHGWQVQTRTRSVQGVLLEAARRRLGPETKITGASRTDAGVHAIRQVASLTTTARMPSLGIRGALNADLPRDIRVLDVREASPGFDARREAIGKRYAYLIDTGT